MNIITHQHFAIGSHLISDGAEGDAEVVYEQYLLPLVEIKEASEVMIQFNNGTKQLWGTEKLE